MLIALLTIAVAFLAAIIPLILGLPRFIREFRLLRTSNVEMRASHEAQIVSNAADHLNVVEALNKTTSEVERFGRRLDDHIAWHAHQAPAPQQQPVVVTTVVPAEKVAS